MSRNHGSVRHASIRAHESTRAHMRVCARSARAPTVSVPKRSHVCLEPGAVDSPAWSTCQQKCADVARACTIFYVAGRVRRVRCSQPSGDRAYAEATCYTYVCRCALRACWQCPLAHLQTNLHNCIDTRVHVKLNLHWMTAPVLSGT
jgi:hypothetical protein